MKKMVSRDELGIQRGLKRNGEKLVHIENLIIFGQYQQFYFGIRMKRDTY